MTNLPMDIETEAIRWLIRIRDPHFDDWESFANWMEDPVRAQAYNALAVDDEDIAELVQRCEPVRATAANDDELPAFSSGNRRAFGWAVAAAIVAAVGYSVLPPSSSPYVVATVAGEHKTIRLADGSRIELNGNTRLLLDHRNNRFARLDNGEANFTVVHDARRPFVVETGTATLVDAGTAFNIVRTGSITEVAVSEGRVIYNPDDEKLSIAPGHMVLAVDGQRPTLSRVDPNAIASWRDGRLIFDGATLAIVARDLSRNLGVAVTVAPELAEKRVSAVIQIKGTGSQNLADIAALLGVEIRRADRGWQFAAEGHASR